MASKTLVAVTLCALLGGAAFAQDSGPRGFEVGLRSGYSLPLGSLQSGRPMSDFTSGLVPIQVDAGYRINGNWFAGAYFQYGFGILKENACFFSSTASCSASDLRFGIQGQFHLLPRNRIDPWVGLGLGYEIVNIDISEGGFEFSTDFTGVEFANVSLGADYRISPELGLGPYLGFTLGQYGSGVGTDIPEKALHMWLSLGVRGVFDVM